MQEANMYELRRQLKEHNLHYLFHKQEKQLNAAAFGHLVRFMGAPTDILNSNKGVWSE